MARTQDETGVVGPPPAFDPNGPSLTAGPTDAPPQVTLVTSLEDRLRAWAATPITPAGSQPGIDAGAVDMPPQLVTPPPTVPLSDVYGPVARAYGRGGPMSDFADQPVPNPDYFAAKAQAIDRTPTATDLGFAPPEFIYGPNGEVRGIKGRAPGTIPEDTSALLEQSSATAHAREFFGPVIGAATAIARGIGSGQSALDLLTIHADALIPGAGQGTLKNRYDRYVSEGAAPDVAANAAMRDYGTALEQYANEDPFAFVAGNTARLIGLAQSISAPAPVPGATSLPFIAGSLEKGAARGITERFIAQGKDVINADTGNLIRRGTSAKDAVGIAERLNTLPPDAFNYGVSRPLLGRIAGEANVKLADQRLLEAAGRRLGPPEDLGGMFVNPGNRQATTDAEKRIMELQRESAATGGKPLENMPPITYESGGNAPLRGFQIEKFPEAIQPFMRDIASKMDPALAAATRKMTNEDIQTAAQLIGRPVSEVAKDLPKRGVTSAQIQMVRQGVAMKVTAAAAIAAKATVGQATTTDMWDAIVSLQEAAAIQATLHEAASEAGRALQVLRTEIAPELASNPTALSYMAAISRVARSPEHANVIFAALQKIGNDPDAVYALLRTLNKPTFGDNILSIWNMPRALKASLDFSAGGRQALISLAAHPGDLHEFYSVMWNSARDPVFADNIERMLRTGSPVQGLQAPIAAELARIRAKAGVFQAETGPLARLSQREEAMMTNLLGHIPGYSASERAYVTPLNWLRATRFDNALIAMQRAHTGIAINDRTASTLAQWVNISTGRGEMPQWLASSVPLLNNIFFAPRFAISRFEALAFPAYAFAKGETEVAKLAAADMTKFIGEGAALLGLLKLGAKAANATDVEVETDPRSPEFGKIKVGSTVIDPWGGEQQVVRNIVQLVTGEKKTVTGKNRGDIVPIPRNETIGRFLESKLSPATSLLWDVSKGATKDQMSAHEGEPFYDQPIGRDFLGQPFSLKDLGISTSASLFLPMSWGDVYDAVQADRAEGGSGIRGALLGATSLAGFGVTTYGEDEGQSRVNPNLVRPAGTRVGGYHVLP